MGFDWKNYDKEADFIVGAVRTCSHITPQMYASLTGRGTRPDLSKFGEQYRFAMERFRFGQLKHSNRKWNGALSCKWPGWEVTV